MSRVLLVGMGVPSFVRARRHAGPGLRTAHFATALARAGHLVLLLAVLDDHEEVASATQDGMPGVRTVFLREKDLDSSRIAGMVGTFAPDAVVGATVYAASLATRFATKTPMWADVFGDILAEAQAKAARTGSDWSLVHFWTLLAPVLERSDRWSAVSTAQAHALLGQLGLAGRLSARTAGEELVHVVPCAAESKGTRDVRERARRGLGFGEDDFVLLLSGGVNTWCDVETATRAIEIAVRAEPRLRVLRTGGGIPGHDERSDAELVAALSGLGASKVRDLGWADSDSLAAIYAASDLGVVVERPLVERALGAESRVVEWMAEGLAVLTTGLSEAGASMVRDGLALGCRAGDPEAVACAILAAARDREGLGKMAARAAEAARLRWGFDATARPLVEWCDSPVFAGDRVRSATGGVEEDLEARVIRLGLVSQPATSARMLEAYVAELPAAEVLRRGVRWVARRALSAAPRLAAVAGRRVRAAAPCAPGGASASRAGLAAGACLAAAVLASMALSGCEAPRAANRRPNILLVSVDTLRADRLGAYGSVVSPSPSPWIDRLAARGVVFEQSVASAPETAPALASLVTGLYQDRHGVGFNRASLGEGVVTLAERLKAGGYATAAFVANRLVDAAHGFGQGFDRSDLVEIELPEATSTDDRLVAKAAEFLREPPSGRPWFAWVHMMDPHGPYNSAPAWWGRGLDYSRATLAADGVFPVSDSNFGLGVIPLYQKLGEGLSLFDYVRRYDAEVRFTDSQLGALLGMLAASGQADDTVVVLTADHGESLVEHDELLQHGWYVYDTTVKVPLVVSWPAMLPGGARVPQQVCSVDVAATLLDLAGVEWVASELDGVSFAHRLGGDIAHRLGGDIARRQGADVAAPAEARDCFSIGPRANHPFAIRRDGIKMILTPAGAPVDPRRAKEPRPDTPERVELYDLVADPGETKDLSLRRPDLLSDLEQPLAAFRARVRANGWRW